ncbi:hypothetical protein C0992_010477 [Termitomyces sp. T32_za158]|nr:hypothetical protein C0992_012497 [Termitomyces sp. T32_za158]KAG6896072.1 hypothetical protein C0992_010477 [Termitomyces sp. T32_za158]
MTIHTNPGCTLPTANSQALSITGSVIGGTDCAALTTGNQGCGIRANSNVSFGAGFNKNGGGTYASELTTLRPTVQSDGPCDCFKCNGTLLVSQYPGCRAQNLYSGDWASGVWTTSGIPGQEQSCAERTGVSTCEAFVRGNGMAMAEACKDFYFARVEWD